MLLPTGPSLILTWNPTLVALVALAKECHIGALSWMDCCFHRDLRLEIVNWTNIFADTVP